MDDYMHDLEGYTYKIADSDQRLNTIDRLWRRMEADELSEAEAEKLLDLLIEDNLVTGADNYPEQGGVFDYLKKLKANGGGME